MRPIEAEQLKKLLDLLKAVRAGNTFYRRKLEAVGGIGSLEEYSRQIPFTRKQELMEDQIQHPPFGTNLTYPLARYSRFSQTSGSTGKPMRWLDTAESWDWMLGNWRRVFDAAGVTREDRIFLAFSFGPFLGFWTAFEAAARVGNLCIPGGGMPSAARLGVILDIGVTVLCSTPTYAIHLAEVAAAEGIDLGRSRVKSLIVAGEPGGSIPATRRRLETVWRGARVWDQHGMTEVGPVSYPCPVREGVLHVMEDAYYAEVIDPASGEAVGGRGELVLTNLGRTGSPLLRYRTGDIVERGQETRCACGTEDMALEGGILGRTDDMVVVRGVNVYPGAVEEILRSAGGVAEYRVKVSERQSLVELSIEVEPETAHHGDEGLAHRLEAALRDALSLRVPVTIAPCGSLPRFEMKARRWVRG
ncbi:MAG: phenylacetate--CoA ligase [Acidimicrobiia bacterium]|nr:phenylacetate--CoA ligase [Acidimicrobiia bacterium]